MLNEFGKSIRSTLYSRTTSPLFGTFVVSWLIWNWKIWYLTLFISEKHLPVNKIDFILSNYCTWSICLWNPLLSTLFLLTIVPFLSNGAYWLHMNFTKWKNDKKNEIEKKQLLTLEQSIKLKQLIADQEASFEKMFEHKNAEIKELKQIIIELQEKQTPKGSPFKNIEEPLVKSKKGTDTLLESIQRDKDSLQQMADFNKLKEKINDKFVLEFKNVQNAMHLNEPLFGIDSELVGILKAYDIIEPLKDGAYRFTQRGLRFLKFYLD